MTVHYAEGRGLAVVGDEVAVLLPDADDPALAVRLAELVTAGGGLAEVLHAVVASAPDGIASLPSFAAVVVRPGAVRVTVRGDVSVRVHAPAGVTCPDGTDVVTWHEQTVMGATGCEIGTVGAGDLTLPVVGGVVRAAGLRLGVVAALGAGPAGAAPAAPAPVPEVLPGPVPLREPGPEGDPATEPEPEVAPRSAVVEVLVNAAAQALVPVLPTLPTSVTGPPAEPLIADVPGMAIDGRTLTDLDETVDPPAAGEAPLSGGQAALEVGPATVTETEAGPDHVYDHLWGMTQVRRVEDAAVRESEDEEPGASPSGDGQAADLNHDGETIGPAALAELRRRRAGQGGAPAQPARPPAAGEVLARLCLTGHATPPERTECHACGAPVTGDAVRRPRPALGHIRMADGTRIALDGSYVLGRKPRVGRVSGEIPRVLTVPSPQGEVSSTHLAVRLEDWHVLAVDLGSSNGSVLCRDGQPPLRLEPQVPVLLRARDVVDLGDGVVLTFEDLP